MELYIHIPFCVKKCDYCDFLSFPSNEETREIYVRALCGELAAAAGECAGEAVSSIYIGGGTPSLLKEGRIAGLMETVGENYALAEDCEISIEANPGTLSEDKLRSFLACGINRLSIGCQSASDPELRGLGRIHTFDEFLRQYEMARAAGFSNINVDLMSAIPGQTIASWERSLRTVAGLGPEHISAYSLIVEEGTPFYDRELILPSEEDERRMYEMTAEILGEYGLHRYEISNYARDGRECRHNVGYWRRVDYLGAGLGAASLRRERRFSNTRDLRHYLDCASSPEQIRENVEELSAEDRMEEFMFLGLRMTDGVSAAEFCRTFGRTMEEVYGPPVDKLLKLGLLEREGDRLRLTPDGISVSNQVFVEFLF